MTPTTHSDAQAGTADRREDAEGLRRPPRLAAAAKTEPAATVLRDTEFAGYPDFSEDAAANKPPKGMGLSEPVNEVEGKTAHSEGVEHPLPERPGAGERKAAASAKE
ncbi:MAG: hypothetical protein IH590_00465 [Aquamicrobium sp.]|nr:hypothetical protein [Aquamicrobium sp.]